MESGAVLAIPGRLGCFVNWQNAKLIPASEPRKLFTSVRSRSKHGANGFAPNPQGPWRKARVASRAAAPDAYCTLDRTIGTDATLSRGPFKAGEREQALDDEATRLIGAHFCGHCGDRRC